MNNKAQADDPLVTIPILIIIVVLMSIYLFLSAAFSLKSPGQEEATLLLVKEPNLMFQTINVEIKDGPALDMLVLDAIKLHLERQLKPTEPTKKSTLGAALQTIVTEKNDCYFLSYNTDFAFGELFKNNEIIAKTGTSFVREEHLSLVRQITFNTKSRGEIEATYYFGPCPK